MATTANVVKLKRSAVAGRIPTTTDLALGELALNTHDGRIYLKKSVSAVESIVTLQPFPTGGSNGQVLVTDNNGVLSWAEQSGGGSFKTWEVEGQSSLVAEGSDSVKIVAGFGITITTDTEASPKSLTITASGDPLTGGIKQTVEYFTGNGIAVEFTLTHQIIDTNYTIVSLNGIELRYGIDYTVINDGYTLRFEEADTTANPPPEDSTISVRIFLEGGAGGPPAVTNFIADGIANTFDIGRTIVRDSMVLVFINSIYQDTEVYTVSGTEVIFTDTPLAGDRVNVVLLTTTLADAIVTIDDLSDVDTVTAAPTIGQTLTWDGTNWVPRTPVTSEDVLILSMVMA